jgi:hypothetical protein
MPKVAKSQTPGGTPPAKTSLSPGETARYTRELLESLRKIAERQGQGVLAHLLALARYEAQTLADAPTVSEPSGATTPQGGSAPLGAPAPKTMTPDSRDDGHSAPPVPVPAER